MVEKRESVTKKGLYGILWNFSGSVIQIILQLVVIGVLARLLDPREFGIVAVIMIFVTFSELFTHMGIGSALIQLPKISRRHISLAYTLSIIVGLLVGLLFYLLAPLASSYFEIEEATSAFRFFSIFFPLRSFNSIAQALLSRKMRFSIIVKLGVLSYFVGVGFFSILFAYLGYGYWALILGQFAGLLITVGVMMYYEPPVFSFRFERIVLKDLLFFGSGHTLGSVFNYFAENADNIVVGKMLGTVAMGIYSKAFQLLAIPAKFFGSIFDKVLFPILSLRQENIAKLSSFYLFSTSLCFALLFPISVLIFVNAELIVDILLGSQWQEVILPMQILIFGLSFRFGTKINKSFLKSMGLIYRNAFYQLIFAILIFLGCYFGGQWYGLVGVAWGVLLATIINYIQVGFRLYRHLDFSGGQFISVFFKAVLLFSPLVVFTILLKYGGYDSQWLHLILSIVVYLPITGYIILHRKHLIFHRTNNSILRQILNSFPLRFKKILQKFRPLNHYYE